MVAEALKRGAGDREELSDFFHSLRDFSGSMGTYSAVRGNNFDLPAQLKIVRNGKFQPYP